MTDKERIAAIQSAAANVPDGVPSTLVDFLLIRGHSVETAAAAFSAWQEKKHWAAPDGTAAWGDPEVAKE